ncbi:leucyl aminopeptidase family protein [Actinomycetospora chibensis]|uniref:leucyl aminopeptidase family protein n=1 Tax=Actinomycetospora chibensis TaxID=663606 RepID=UPI002366300C|nr:leucyl aminopeptidase family protein [Actinomycetospora chibensis]MDD7923464.1 leucyl aminopeptidase family protein [Actinomycetospora chibensis]
MTGDAPFASPALPTPLATLTTAVPDGPVAVVRWRRRDGADSADGTSDETTETAASATDDGGGAVEGAPPGWRPSAGSVAALPGPAPAQWLVGVGEGRPRDWRAAGAAAVRALRDAPGAAVGAGDGPRVATLAPARPEDLPGTADDWASLALGVVLGSHRFAIRSEAPARLSVHLDVPAEHHETVERAVELATATARARDLADTPSGTKSPDWFATTATDLVADARGLEVTVRDETWLAEHGFGGVLAVGGGSSRPPRFLELRWSPGQAAPDAGHVVLVGKGITFDTGGISIKPNAGMADMRTDCSGGAAVVAAMRAVARLGVPVRVTGLVPLAENHVSGSAYRPGDVVRHRGGTTSEVTNTDAEGRMVLADAIAFALEELAPDVVVDVATLTGAMKVALGVRTGGVFASSPDLRTAIVDAGAAVGEAWWPMPLSAHLDSDVDSTIADVRQAPPGPGGIAAALFLRRFTDGRPWVHLDIAGPARCDSPHEEVAKGATGFATRTLVEFCAARGLRPT